MIVKLLNEHHLEFLSLIGGCPGSSESTHVKMPHSWKPHALAQILKYVPPSYGSITQYKWDAGSRGGGILGLSVQLLYVEQHFLSWKKYHHQSFPI